MQGSPDTGDFIGYIFCKLFFPYCSPRQSRRLFSSRSSGFPMSLWNSSNAWKTKSRLRMGQYFDSVCILPVLHLMFNISRLNHLQALLAQESARMGSYANYFPGVFEISLVQPLNKLRYIEPDHAELDDHIQKNGPISIRCAWRRNCCLRPLMIWGDISGHFLKGATTIRDL